MIGPFEQGHWSKKGAERSFGAMIAGERYVVTTSFVDFDGDVHPVRESWTFLGAAFLPYEDGQSLFVSLDGEREWHIRMRWRTVEQAKILDHFEEYVQLENGS